MPGGSFVSESIIMEGETAIKYLINKQLFLIHTFQVAQIIVDYLLQ